MADIPVTAVAAILPPDPLQYNVPIVNEQGWPTPQFIQQWLKSRNLTLAVDDNSGAAIGGVYTTLDNYYTKAEVDARKIPFVKADGTHSDIPLRVGG